MSVELYQNNGYLAFDCPGCAMEVKVERHGRRIVYSDRGGCGFDFSPFDELVLARLNGVHKDKDEDEDYLSPTCSPTPNPYELKEDGEAHVTWCLRAHDGGHIQPKPVELPPLPPSATPSMEKVADFYRRVRGLRLLDDDDRPVPFACAWVGGYVGLSPRGVSGALRRLVAAGVLRRADEKLDPLPEKRGEKKRATHLYLPGDGS